MPELPDNPALAEAGRYGRRREANDRALVVLAMGLGCWLFRDGSQFVLCVERRRLEAVGKELEKFELENRRVPTVVENGKVRPLSLFVFAWMMTLFFLLQQRAPEWWIERGGASPQDILKRGQWWRTVTALTLHADLPHLAANLAAGLLFSAFLLPMLGTGVTWTGILLSGALGNLANAWFYNPEPRVSIGASTAVFGALGMLTARQAVNVLSGPRRVRLWEMILPLGAGASLLAYLGTEGEHTDFMAHFWGFTAGCGLGAFAPRRNIRFLVWLPPAIVLAAWLRAAG